MSELVLYSGAYNGPQIDAAVSRALAGGALDKRIDAVAASPLVAATAADMTDQTRIYVYTGNEAGYTTGNWYYYDGSAWADGGAYQAAAADATLSDVSINPVQNRAVKAAIDLKADQTNVDTIQTQTLSAYITGTASGTYHEGEGYYAYFNDGADNIPVADLTVDINLVQSGSGTPSPSNIRPITGRTGAYILRYGADESDNPLTLTYDWSGTAGVIYGGTLDVTTGLLTVDRAGVDMGSLAWTYHTTGAMYVDINAKSSGVTALLCSAYNYVPNSGFAVANNTISNTSAASMPKRIFVKDTNYTTAAAFKTAVTGQTIVYMLQTPVTYQLTPQEVTTLLGDNNIYADTGDVAVTYRRDPTLAYNNLVNAIISLGGNV